MEKKLTYINKNGDIAIKEILNFNGSVIALKSILDSVIEKYGEDTICKLKAYDDNIDIIITNRIDITSILEVCEAVFKISYMRFNTSTLRLMIKNLIETILNDKFKIKCDETNNPPDIISANSLMIRFIKDDNDSYYYFDVLLGPDGYKFL